jgi:hypothetical protein
MTIEVQQNKPGRLTTIVRRVSGSARVVRDGAASLVGRLPATARATQAGASNLMARVPATARATHAGLLATTGALQQLPDTTLRSLAASSAGLGAGLYLAGKNKLLVVAGVIPAIVVGAAIAWRPAKAVAAPTKSGL